MAPVPVDHRRVDVPERATAHALRLDAGQDDATASLLTPPQCQGADTAAPHNEYVLLHEREAAVECGAASWVGEAAAQCSVGLPVAGTMAVNSFMQLLCLAFVGHLGTQELACASIATALANVTGFSLLEGLASAMETVCGQAYGAGDLANLGTMLQRVHLILTLACLPISACWLATRPLLLFTGQDHAIASGAALYIAWEIPGLVASAAFLPITKFMQVQGVTLPLTLISLVSLLFLSLASYLLIHTFALGFTGAAMALSLTLLFQLLLALLYLALFDSSHQLLSRCWRGWSLTLCFSGWWPYLTVAVPSCAMICLEWWFFEIVTLVSGLLPNPAVNVAAMTISLQTAGFCFMFSLAFGIAASVRVSNALGAKSPAAARRAVAVAMCISVLLSALIALFLLFIRDFLILFFTGASAPDVAALVRTLMPFLIVSQPGLCLPTILSGVLRGSGQQAVGTGVNGFTFYAIALPLAYGLAFHPFHLGVSGLWLSIIVGEAIQTAIFGYYVATTDWSAQVTSPRECREIQVSQHTTWAPALTLQQFLQREQQLGSHAWAQANLRTWALVSDADGSEEQAEARTPEEHQALPHLPVPTHATASAIASGSASTSASSTGEQSVAFVSVPCGSSSSGGGGRAGRVEHRRVLASLETYRQDALLLLPALASSSPPPPSPPHAPTSSAAPSAAQPAAAPSDSPSRARKGNAYGIASVFTPPAMRGQGLATHLCRAVPPLLAQSDPSALAAVLYSDVGEHLYARAGFTAPPHVLPPSMHAFGVRGGEEGERRVRESSARVEWLRRGDQVAAAVDGYVHTLSQRASNSASFLVLPSAAQVDWMVEREHFCAQLLGVEPLPWSGARCNDALMVWSMDVARHSKYIKVLLFHGGSKPSDTAAVVAAAVHAAMHARIPCTAPPSSTSAPSASAGGAVVAWGPEAITGSWPIQDRHLAEAGVTVHRGPRSSSIPMLAPLSPAVAAPM
ncbi:unnamed protein product, partial [Closterium sp. Naga37s-1]